jgi:hypothetical protein
MKMPKATKGGASNAWDAGPDEAGPEAGAEMPPPPPVSAPKAEHVAYAADALGVPPEEAAEMKKTELVDLARQAQEPPAGPPAPAPLPRSVPPAQ